MRLQYYDRNHFGSYWDTPEGRLFSAADTAPYDRKLAEYDDLSRQVLPQGDLYAAPPAVS